MNFVHPDDREATIHTASGLTTGTTVLSFQNRYRCKTGAYKWFEWTSRAAIEEGLIYATVRDVTARNRREARLRHLLSSSPVILYAGSFDGDYPVTFISENVTAELGYDPDEFLRDSRFWTERIHPDDVMRVITALEQIVHTERLSHEYRFQHQDGSYRIMRDEVKLVRDERGHPIEIVGSLQDVTEKRHAEKLIEAQAAALNELSTPLIPISDDVVVMPLIGTIDSERARQVIEALLEGIAKSRAGTAILDITGVPVVDTQVASALLRAAKAVELLGAEIVLTGIRPVIAQTLVTIGADLSGIVTRGTLKSGIEYATRKARGEERR